MTTFLNNQSISILGNRLQMKDSSATPTRVSSNTSQRHPAFPDFQKPVVPDFFPDSLLQMFVTIVAT
jgi:hypothetical protein